MLRPSVDTSTFWPFATNRDMEWGLILALNSKISSFTDLAASVRDGMNVNRSNVQV